MTPGKDATVIGAIGDRELLASLPLEGFPGVEQVLPILKPYKLVSKEMRRGPTVIDVPRAAVGDGYFGLIAGPCSVEYREQTLRGRAGRARRQARRCCAAARSSRAPRRTRSRASAQEGLDILKEAREETGLPIVTELMDARDVEAVVDDRPT